MSRALLKAAHRPLPVTYGISQEYGIGFLTAGCSLFHHGLYRTVHYVQGQAPEPKIREYFYYIDHQGQLFLDDARIKNFTSCFKEKKFLHFFTSRIRINNLSPERYPEFPYLSPCGRERNFLRCDDRPIVYTQLLEKDGEYRISYNGGGELLCVEFNPELLSMDPTSGRVYYPSPSNHADLGRGLVKSSLAVEFSKGFVFELADESRPPKWFNWLGKKFALKNGDWLIVGREITVTQ